MAALEDITKNEAKNANDSFVPTIKLKIATFLASVPEPAAQSAAMQLLKSKFVMDRSFIFCMGLISMAVLEELL
jgi:hypothetical protein